MFGALPFVSFIDIDGSAYLGPANQFTFQHSIKDGKVYAIHPTHVRTQVDHDFGIMYGSFQECLDVHNTYVTESKHETNIQLINLGKYAKPEVSRHIRKPKPS